METIDNIIFSPHSKKHIKVRFEMLNAANFTQFVDVFIPSQPYNKRTSNEIAEKYNTRHSLPGRDFSLHFPNCKIINVVKLSDVEILRKAEGR